MPLHCRTTMIRRQLGFAPAHSTRCRPTGGCAASMQLPGRRRLPRYGEKGSDAGLWLYIGCLKGCGPVYVVQAVIDATSESASLREVFFAWHFWDVRRAGGAYGLPGVPRTASCADVSAAGA